MKKKRNSIERPKISIINLMKIKKKFKNQI